MNHYVGVTQELATLAHFNDSSQRVCIYTQDPWLSAMVMGLGNFGASTLLLPKSILDSIILEI